MWNLPSNWTSKLNVPYRISVDSMLTKPVLCCQYLSIFIQQKNIWFHLFFFFYLLILKSTSLCFGITFLQQLVLTLAIQSRLPIIESGKHLARNFPLKPLDDSLNKAKINIITLYSFLSLYCIRFMLRKSQIMQFNTPSLTSRV
jgi:hypothetical protein